jgi:hypothetical protein
VYEYIVSYLAGRILVLYVQFSHGVVTSFQQKQSGQATLCSTIDNLDRLKTEHPNMEITIAWIPGHRNIHGNDKADEAAKNAAEYPITVPNANVLPLKSTRNWSIKNTCKKEWERMWKTSSHDARQLRRITTKRQVEKGHNIYRSLSKRLHIAYLARLRTGHCNLRQYHHRFGRADNPYCECGDGSIENVEHYLLSCRKYDRQREKLRRNVGFGGMWMEKLLGHPRLIKYTLEYVEETGMMKIQDGNQI